MQHVVDSRERSHSPRHSRAQKRSRHNGSAPATKAHLVHRMHGRARFRVRGHRNDHEYFDSLADHLRHVPGVSRVETNATTGSLLILHDGGFDELVEAIMGESGLGRLMELVLQSPPIANRLREQVAGMDDALQRSSGGNIDLETVASFGLLGLAGAQLFLGLQIAGAVSLTWYAAELIRRSSNGQPIGTPPD
jgi:hypothetical protein